MFDVLCTVNERFLFVTNLTTPHEFWAPGKQLDPLHEGCLLLGPMEQDTRQ